MKKSPNRIVTDAFREIRNTLSRFLSLFLLSALAVAFLAGLRTTAPDMEHTADDYYDRTHLMDVRVLSTLGLTDGDIAALRAAPGVEKAEGAWYVDATVHASQNDYIVRFHSLSALGINDPELLEGRLPISSDECVVEPALLESVGLRVGDVLELDTAGTDYEDSLRRERYTIVGTVHSSLYLSRDRGTSTIGTGRLSAVAFLPREVFDLDYYTEAYLLAEGGAELLCYGDDYEDLMDGLLDSLESLGEERAGLRYEEVIGEANDKLDEAQQEYEDAEAEVNEKLSDAERELADARKKLDDGWAEYYDGQRTLARETREAEEEIADAEQTLADALVELEQGEVDYADGVQKLSDGQKEYEDGLREYRKGLADYAEGRRKLEEAQAEYDDGWKAYKDGLKKYEDGEKELKEAKRQLSAASAELSAGRAQYNAGVALLEEQKQVFAAGKAAFDTQFAQAKYVLAEMGIDTNVEDAVLIETLRAMLPMLETTQPETAAMLQMLVNGWDEVQSGAAQIAAAQAQLDAAKSQLDAGQQEYSAGRRQYEKGLEKLEQAKQELDEAKAKLDDGKKELDEGWAELRDADAELRDGAQKLADAQRELEEGRKDLQDAREKLDDGWVEYEDGLAELQEARETLAQETTKAQRELNDAYAELTDGETEYADGVQEYEDGKAEAEEELSDARRKLSDARRDISEIENCKWYLLSRNTNMGYVSFQQDAERMGNLASVFPLIFFLVAALVCLTTMTRMVEEQRVQIGGLKALGYSRNAIAFKYVGYGFLSSFGGGVIGLGLGCTLIPTIIFNAWKVMYTVGELQITLFPGIYLMAVGAAVFCVTGTALASSYAALTAVPATLMRPKAPPAGKRVLLERVNFIWKRLSFTRKVTVRNLFRYKKRFWMTVIGIGGCTALLITGFGLRDSIHDIFDRQYDEVTTYHGQVSLAEDVTEVELLEITRELDKSPYVEHWTTISDTMVTAEGPKRSMDSYVYLNAVTDESKFGDFVHLRDRVTGEPIPLTGEGAVITEKLADTLGVKVGDTITIVDDNVRTTMPVTGITENYVFHYIYLSHGAYLSIYGKEPPVNSIMTQYTEDTVEVSDAVGTALVPLSGVSSVTRTASLRESIGDGLKGLDYAVAVIVASAAALAFVVLYNLTNINITERMRELATLKVLGFNDREMSAYVSRENTILTFFGVLLGLVMGKYLHRWLVLTVEIDMAMFGRTVEGMSYVFAVALTILFSLLVNLAAKGRLRKIDMVESLKTVE